MCGEIRLKSKTNLTTLICELCNQPIPVEPRSAAVRYAPGSMAHAAPRLMISRITDAQTALREIITMDDGAH